MTKDTKKKTLDNTEHLKLTFVLHTNVKGHAAHKMILILQWTDAVADRPTDRIQTQNPMCTTTPADKHSYKIS